MFKNSKLHLWTIGIPNVRSITVYFPIKKPNKTKQEFAELRKKNKKIK